MTDRTRSGPDASAGARPADERPASFVTDLDHVQLAIPPGGEQSADAFYSQVLGLAVVPKPEPLAARGGRWYEAGGVRIHLGIETDFRPARKAHPALVVSDLAGLIERLRGAGHEVTPAEELDGRQRAFVDDPFGNRIELMESTDRPG